MKKLLFIAIVAVLFTACSIDSKKPAEITINDGTVFKCDATIIEADFDKLICLQSGGKIFIDWKNIQTLKNL